MLPGFFRLHRSERRVVVALLLAAVVALGVALLAGGDDATAQADALAAQADSARARRDTLRPRRYYRAEERRAERFPFDPNTADSAQLLRLGLQPWQVRAVYKYRAAGGVFRRPLDFARLYGLTAGQYKSLEPYIRIGRDYQTAATLLPARTDTLRDSLRYPVKIAATERVVLNRADTTILRTVPGIGVYFARQIVSYGDRLGGYVNVDQLDEIDGFPQESKQYFVVEAPQPRRLAVNRLTLQQLRRHPYVNFYQAKAIVDYRRLRGPLKSLDDLKLSKDFPPAAISRLAPYVEF